MSEELAAAAADLAEMARLTTELRGLRDIVAQQQRAIDAERAARRAAEADLAEMANIILDAAIWLDQLSSTDGSGHRDLAHRLREIITRHSPGQALHAELDACRAYFDYVDNYANPARMSEDERALWDAAWKARGE